MTRYNAITDGTEEVRETMETLIALQAGTIDLSGAPEEIKILPLGEVKSTKGTFLVDDASVIEKLPVEELDSSAPETGEESEESEDLAKETAVKFGNNGGSGTLFWVGLSLILLGVLGVGTVIYLQVAPRLKARAAGAAAENDVMEDISSHERAEEPAQTPPADPSAEPPADPSADTIDLESLMK